MLKYLDAYLLGWRQSLTWRVLVNAGWASAATPINITLGIIQTGLMARMLGPEGLGVIALFGAICGLFGKVLKLTSAETAMVYVSKALAEGDNSQAGHIIRYCYSIDFLTSFVAFSAVGATSLFLPRLLDLPHGVEWLQTVFGLSLILQSTYWTSHALLRVANRFSWTFYASVAHSAIKTTLMAWLFLAGAGLTAVVFLLVGLSLLDGAILYVLARISIRQLGIDVAQNMKTWWRVSNEVWRFQWLGYLREIVKSMNRSIDTLAIGFIGNPLQVGFYRAGKQIGDQIQIPAQGFLASLFPEYSRLYFSGNMRQLRRLTGRFAAMFLSMGLLASLVLWFGAEWIILVILGEAFLPATDAVRILIVSGVILLVMSPVYSLPAAVGRAGPALRSAMVAMGVQVIVILWLVPRLGVVGAAWANVAYVVTWAVVLLPSILQVLRGPCPEAGRGRSEVKQKVVEPADVS